MRSEGQLALDDKGRAIMVLRVLTFDTPNPHLQHFSVPASGGGRLKYIARSDGSGPENHRGNFGGFHAKTIFNCNVTFSECFRPSGQGLVSGYQELGAGARRDTQYSVCRPPPPKGMGTRALNIHFFEKVLRVHHIELGVLRRRRRRAATLHRFFQVLMA